MNELLLCFAHLLLFGFRHRRCFDSQVSHRDPRLTRSLEAEPPSRRSLNKLVALRRRVPASAEGRGGRESPALVEAAAAVLVEGLIGVLLLQVEHCCVKLLRCPQHGCVSLSTSN